MDKTAGDGPPRETMSRHGEPELLPMGDPVAVASYIAALSEELSRLARGNGLLTLAYILEMARLEARSAMMAKAPGDNERR